MNRDFHQFLDVYQENNPLNDPYYLRRLTIFLKEAQQAMDEANPDSADFIKQYLIQTAKLRLIANNISEAAQRYTPGFNFILQAAQRAEAACIKANARAFRLEATPDSILSPEERFKRNEGDLVKRTFNKLIEELSDLYIKIDETRLS